MCTYVSAISSMEEGRKANIQEKAPYLARCYDNRLDRCDDRRRDLMDLGISSSVTVASSESRSRKLHIRRDAGEGPPNPLDPSIIIAPIRDQLGLIAKFIKCSDFLVIDRAEKALVGN